jgi:LacI family transcriptional regulator
VPDAPASIREVAAHAGVSVGTVSNVLNRPGIVAEPTRSRVRDAIKQLGFIRTSPRASSVPGAAAPSAWSC